MAFLSLTPIVMYQNAVASSVTGTTSPTTLMTGPTIPANQIGANEYLEIWSLWTATNNANGKTAAITIGGTSVLTRAMANIASYSRPVFNWWRSTNNSGLRFPANSGSPGWGNSTVAINTTAVNAGSDVAILFRGTLTDVGDTITCEAATVILWKKVAA